MNHDRPLIHRARQLREDQTTAEARPWRELRNRRFVGSRFRRQQPIGPNIADSYSHQAGLVVELDGESHFGRDEYDRRRQEWLESRGLNVPRFFNRPRSQALADLDGAIRPDDPPGVRGSGHVVVALHSARLGHDTGTTAAVVGGIAGLRGGERYESLRRDLLARHDRTDPTEGGSLPR